MDDIAPILQTNLLLNLRTGNTIIDAILTVLLVYLTKKLIDEDLMTEIKKGISALKNTTSIYTLEELFD